MSCCLSIKGNRKKLEYFKDLKSGKLTKSEYKVLRLLIEGKSNIQIAKDLCISPHTVKAHVSNIIYKLRVGNRIQVAVKAITEKLMDEDTSF